VASAVYLAERGVVEAHGQEVLVDSREHLAVVVERLHLLEHGGVLAVGHRTLKEQHSKRSSGERRQAENGSRYTSARRVSNEDQQMSNSA